MGKKEKCPHPSWSWGPWIYVEGVTSGIQYRDRTCDKCAEILERQTRSV